MMRGYLRAIAPLVLILLVAGACNQQESTPTPTPPTEIVVESGVVALTPASDADSAGGDLSDTAAAAGETAALDSGANAVVDAIQPGAEVAARGMLRVYAAAEPTATTLAEYGAGDRFVVMDPPGDVTQYPVERSGVRWYRVRADDGLVGWVIADGIEQVERSE